MANRYLPLGVVTNRKKDNIMAQISSENKAGISMKKRILKSSLMAFSFVATFGMINSCSDEAIVGQTSSPKAVHPFELTDVTLLDGPFKHATDLNIQSLLQYEPDRLLARFRTEAGLAPKAEAYGGWEGESLAGHSLGHYLSACSLMYLTTGNKEFKDRADYIVRELDSVQQANGGGYLGAFTDGKKVFETEIAKGEIRSQGFDMNGIWSPFYTHHKVMAGLRDAYRLLGNAEALKVERNFADWVGTIVLGLNHDQAQEMLHCEFGGMQETLVDLYEDTKEERYMEIAKVFHHDEIMDPLTNGIDILPGKHGNTQIPKLIASSRLYELTGEKDYQKPAEFFWSTVVNHHTYVTGGHGNDEYFGQPDSLRNRLSEGTTETCNVYNMLKLSNHLFDWEPRAEVSDFYERALFNHILASQHPQTGKVIYNLSLEMGGHKNYEDPLSFTCCVGSAMETHSKYGGSIYYKNDNELYAAQYIASEVNWKEKEVRLTQQTQYPEDDKSRFTFHMGQPQKFTFYIRYPHWAQKGIEVTINGKLQKINAQPGTYLPIVRDWKDGDEVTVRIPFSLRLESMPDDDQRIAVFNGPLVLAGSLGTVDDARATDLDFVPVFMSEDRSPENWLQPVAGENNTFKTNGIGHPRDVVLKPFYRMNDERYSIYFDLYDQQKWDRYQQENKVAEERAKALRDMTYDAFQPGEMQTERNHNFTGKDLNLIEDFKGRKARSAERGGWIAFDMKVKPGAKMALVMEYWGGYTGSKTFDIQIDGKAIATENISGKKDGHFINIQYDIPTELTKGKEKVTVKLMPHTGHRAGPFFFARTIGIE